MMIVPVIPALTDDGKVLVGNLHFEGMSPEVRGDTEPYGRFAKDLSSRTEEGTPFLVVDTKGIRDRDLDSVLLKNMRVRGRNLWLMTCVETVDDVFDAFNTYADSLLFPYHLVRSESDLDEIHRMSDKAYPAIFVRNGMPYSRIRGENIVNAMDRLCELGFYKMAVMDLDGSLSEGDWKVVSGHGSVMPFAAGGSVDLEALGFDPVLRSAL